MPLLSYGGGGVKRSFQACSLASLSGDEAIVIGDSTTTALVALPQGLEKFDQSRRAASMCCSAFATLAEAASSARQASGSGEGEGLSVGEGCWSISLLVALPALYSFATRDMPSASFTPDVICFDLLQNHLLAMHDFSCELMKIALRHLGNS